MSIGPYCIIEATGEIGIRAGLGLELTGGASVQIAWTPIDGLELDASIFGEARPKFSINLIADARVVVDAFLWSGTLWNEEWYCAPCKEGRPLLSNDGRAAFTL